jgi:hypothetical protein
MTGGALIRFGKISFFSQGTGALKYEATVILDKIKSLLVFVFSKAHAQARTIIFIPRYFMIEYLVIRNHAAVAMSNCS